MVSPASECFPSSPQTSALTISGSASAVFPLPGDISVVQPLSEGLLHGRQLWAQASSWAPCMLAVPQNFMKRDLALVAI